MNAAGTQATFFSAFHLTRLSFVPLVSVGLFFPVPFFSSGGRERCVCDDGDSVLQSVHSQKRLLSAPLYINK